MVVKDTKDWTWVLERPCPECGFAASRAHRGEIPSMIRANAAAWPALLARPNARRRPSPDVWSALEYGCHVRDVFSIYDGRLARMLAEDDPLYPNWDQDATAVAEQYATQDAPRVAAELQAEAERLAHRFEQVSGDQWLRTGRRSDGAQFTIESFARYLIHDPIHHLHDVARGNELLDRSV